MSMQELLRDVRFGRSGRLWQAYIHWLKCEVLGGVRGRVSLLDIRRAHSDAMQVFPVRGRGVQTFSVVLSLAFVAFADSGFLGEGGEG